MVIEGVIFDMDGLMFDTEPVWTQAWVPTLEAIGREFIPELADAVRGTSGTSMEAIIQRFLPEEDPVSIRERLFSCAHTLMEAGVPKKPGLDELLEYLCEQGLPMAVASSSTPDLIAGHLTRGGVRDYFSELVSGAGMANPKPAPDVFLKAASVLGVEPSKTLVIEDSIAGVRAGLAGGFITVMVPDLVAPDEFVLSSDAHICTSLLELRDKLLHKQLA